MNSERWLRGSLPRQRYRVQLWNITENQGYTIYGSKRLWSKLENAEKVRPLAPYSRCLRYESTTLF